MLSFAVPFGSHVKGTIGAGVQGVGPRPTLAAQKEGALKKVQSKRRGATGVPHVRCDDEGGRRGRMGWGLGLGMAAVS